MSTTDSTAQLHREHGEPGYYVVEGKLDRAVGGPYAQWSAAQNEAVKRNAGVPWPQRNRFEVRLVGESTVAEP